MPSSSSFCKFAIIVCCFSSILANYPVKQKRTLPSLLDLWNRFYNCGLRSCPPWKCQDDSAVLHGYCCECPGSENDNVPIPCYPDLKCPVSPEPLCSDYNFMMDCCCTGFR